MMNKKNILCIFMCLIFLIPVAHAVEVKVKVRGNIGGYIEYFQMEKEVDSVQKFLVQWYNSESVSCLSRMEYRIEKNGETIDRVWSDEKEMRAGVSRHFEAYWLPGEEGNYSTTLIIHHCHDTIESEPFNFSVESLKVPEETIKIKAENLPERKIEITLKSESDLEKVLVIPTNYPGGWIFNGEELASLKAGKETKIVMEYEPSVWMEETLNLQAIGLDGEHSSQEINFKLEEKKYFWDEYGYIIFLGVLSLLVLSFTFNIFLARKIKRA